MDLTLSPTIAPYGAFTNKNSTACDPIQFCVVGN